MRILGRPNTSPQPPSLLEEAQALQREIGSIDTRITEIATAIPREERRAAEQEELSQTLHDRQLSNSVEIGRLSVDALREGVDRVGYRAAGLPSNPYSEHDETQRLHALVPGARSTKANRDLTRLRQGAEDHSLLGRVRQLASRASSWAN